MAKLRKSFRLKKKPKKEAAEDKKDDEATAAAEDPIQIEPFDKKSKFRWFFFVIFKIQRVQHALSVPLFSVFPVSYPLLDSDNSADIY